MSVRNQILLAAIAGLMFFINLGGAHLWDIDEAIFSQAAKEMLQRGDYVVPHFNGHVFPDKPAMMYWLMIGAYQVFGTTEFAARCASALFGIGSVLLTYRLGRLMFSPAVAFWSGLVLASCLQFNVLARAATPDSFLVFFSTLALLFFVSGTARARVVAGAGNERNSPWAGQTTFQPSWGSYALAYAAMGCGVLTKGPVGVVLPTAVIGLFLLIMRAAPVEPSHAVGWRGAAIDLVRWLGSVFSPKLFFQTVSSMRPLTAVAMVLAVAAPWYVWVGMRTDGEWLVGFFGVHNFGRFLNAMENHRGPIFYYLVAMAVGFFPWCVLFGPALSHMKKQLAERHPWRAGYVLVCSWFAVWVGFFSLAGTKLPSYVGPAYPALALFAGCFIDSWLRDPATMSRRWARLAWGTVALVGVGMLVAFPIVAHVFLHDDWLLAATGLLPLAAAAVGIVLSERGEVRGAVGTLATLGVVFAIALFGFGAAHVDRYQNAPPLAERIAAETPPGEQPAIAAFHFFRPSMVFYTDTVIDQFQSPEQVSAFFAAHPKNAFLITTEERLETLAPLLPADVAVLDSRPRFLQAGSVTLLGRVSADANTAKKAAPAPSKASLR